MNKIYRSIWSESLGAWVAAAETTRARGGRGAVRATIVAVATLLGGANAAWASLSINDGSLCMSQSGPGQTWTCHVPNGKGGFAVITGLPDVGNGSSPDWTAVASAAAANLGTGALLLGNTTTVATGTNSIAVGNGAKATIDNAIAMGTSANASGAGSVAIGYRANTDQANGIAIGTGAVATGVSGSAQGTGGNPMAIGVNAKANGYEATALGYKANATGYATTAIGVTATATSFNALALGNFTFASGYNSAALGSNATASNTNATAVGNGSTASGVNATALGSGAIFTTQGPIASGDNAVAIATGAKAAGNSAIAIGTSAQATGAQSISIGMGNVVSGARSGAIGDPTYITGDDSYAIGNNNSISAAKAFVLGNNVSIATGVDGAVALGDSSGVTQAGGVALGNRSQATTAAGVVGYDPSTGTAAAAGTAIANTTSTLAAVSVGGNGQYRQITNVAAGYTDSDAVNVSQLKAVSAAAAAGAVHYYSVNSTDQSVGSNYANDGATGAGALAAGYGARAAGQGAAAVGPSANAAGQGSLAAGDGAAAGDAGSVALGLRATAKGAFTTAIGVDAGNGSTVSSGVLIGDGAGTNSSGDHNSYVGSGAGTQASGSNNSAFGAVAGSVVKGNGNTAFGFAAGEFVTGDSNIAFGNAAAWLVTGNQNTGIGSYAGFATSGNDNYASGSYAGIGTSGNNNVAIGTSAGTGYSVDPATGNFLDRNGAVATALPSIALNDTVAIGNKAIVDADRTVVIGANAQATLANNVVLGNGSVDKAAVQVSSATVPGVIATLNPDGTVTYSAGPAITYGPFAGTATGVVSVGAKNAERQIVNVAPGAITADSTDAVNGSQLYQVASTVNTLGGSITTIVNNAQTHYYSVNDGGSQQANYNNAGASGANSVASGPGASTSTAATNSVAVGANASTTAANSVAVGSGATASTNNSVALGNGSTTTAATPTASTTIQGQTYNFAGANPTGVVSVGAPGAERQIQNVAAGQLSATSTDAVNGSQLYATNQAINNIQVGGAGIKYFHANSQAADSQASGANSVAIGPQSIALGTNSFAGGNGAQANGAGSIALGTNAIATSGNGVALGNGASADRAGMNGQQEMFSSVSVLSTQGAVSVGSAGNERQITNVAGGTQATDAVNVRQLQAVQQSTVRYDTNPDGSVNYNSVTMGNGGSSGPVAVHNVASGVAPTDAVNVQQLQGSVANSAAYTDARVNQMGQSIDEIGKKAFAGVAAAMAMESAPYVPGKVTYAAGMGYYERQSAVGVSLRKTADNGRWSITGGASASTRGTVGFRVGIGGVWD